MSMLIQVHTDDNIEGREKLVSYVKADVGRILNRFSDQITRLEIHLSDENGDKPGNTDKRCLLEARPASSLPVAVSHEGATLEEAWTGAAKKMQRLLESSFERTRDHKGCGPIPTDDIA